MRISQADLLSLKAYKEDPKQITWVIFIFSFTFGLIAGIAYSTLQDAVEVAQVQAGIVNYIDKNNVIYIYSNKVWTIYIQICSFLLMLGISERYLCFMLSGLLGAISFSAISLIVLSVSRIPILAIMCPLIIFQTHAYKLSYSYPNAILNFSYTFGVLGLSFTSLMIAFFSLNIPSIGFFILGILPSIHFSIGAWFWILTIFCLIWDRNFTKTFFQKILFFCSGAFISSISFIMHQISLYQIPSLDKTLISKYFWNFINFWDVHRNSFPFSIEAILITVSVILAWIYISKGHRLFQIENLILFRYLFLSGLFGLSMAILFNITPLNNFPIALIAAMPVRLTNLNLLLLIPIALSILITIVLNKLQPYPLSTKYFNYLLLSIFLSIFIIFWIDAYKYWTDKGNLKTDPFFIKASQNTDLLLTGSDLRLIQLQTRRPILLDGGSLDSLPYTIEAAPLMERILKDIYGLELMNPPTKMQATIPSKLNKPIWENRTYSEWKNIKKTYHISDIITYADWTLQLPIKFENKYLKLYTIP